MKHITQVWRCDIGHEYWWILDKDVCFSSISDSWISSLLQALHSAHPAATHVASCTLEDLSAATAFVTQRWHRFFALHWPLSFFTCWLTAHVLPSVSRPSLVLFFLGIPFLSSASRAPLISHSSWVFPRSSPRRRPSVSPIPDFELHWAVTAPACQVTYLSDVTSIDNF